MADRFCERVVPRLGLAARDWRRINEGLVKRGEILLDLRILDRWDSELAEMNARKEGGRYVYPEIFVRLLGYVHLLFHLPYRQTEGFLKALRRFDSRSGHSGGRFRHQGLESRRLDAAQVEGATQLSEDPHRRRRETETNPRIGSDR